VITVDQGQCSLDISLQYGGHIEAAVSLALKNNISITDDLPPGSLLQNPNIYDKQIVSYFDRYKVVVATNTDETLFRKKKGIGYWKIGRNFKVS
jgi:hypothetical protein